MTSRPSSLPQEAISQYTGHLNRQLAREYAEIAVDAKVQERVRAAGQRFLQSVQARHRTNPEVLRMARNRLSPDDVDAFRRQMRVEVEATDGALVASGMGKILQTANSAELIWKVYGEKLSIYWANNSEWSGYGANQVARFRDIVSCMKEKKEKLESVAVIAYLRLADDAYRGFIRQCRKTGEGDETADDVRARELLEAVNLLAEVDELMSVLPQHLDLYLIDLEDDGEALGLRLERREARLTALLEDPSVRCEPPSKAAAAFRARAQTAIAEGGGLAARADAAAAHRTRACESLVRAEVDDAARQARSLAGEAESLAPGVTGTLTDLVREGEGNRPQAVLEAFNFDAVRRGLERLGAGVAEKRPQFAVVSDIEADARAKIDKGKWLSGRWRDREAGRAIAFQNLPRSDRR